MNLKDEIMAGESYSLEFKRVPNEDRIKYLKTVVAFANGKGGRILFGVGNDRSIVGVPTDQVFQQMDAITDSIANGCAPRIPMDISIENIDGKSVIALDVFAGTRCPYYLKSEGEKDGVYLRVGATTRAADDVAVYDTRVEITSPGGLPRGLTVEKALAGCSKVRNKAIAEALSYMRYVEGW